MTTETTTGAPAGYATVTPWVIVDGAADFIRWVTAVFGAEERFPPVYADDTETRIAHAEVQVGDSVLMVFDRGDDWVATPTHLNLYVPDCDATHHRALGAGAEEVTPLATTAWGDRGSRIRDPFGNLWWVQTHLEDLDDAEIERRMAEPAYVDAMERFADTLDDALRRP
ncbi:VOC family protein [Nitriliruptoraceae bacterium ZYF776]|nr:VOC family protein [Profundirhabdus halotolerans]